MGHYTLLADENSAYSKSENLYADFKAHLIYNIILNGDITFSDNQVMSSPNLRLLARRDGVIEEALKEGKFTLAVRDASFKDGFIDIAEIFEAFKLEQKLPKHFDVYDDSPEIPFIGKHAIAKPWSFQDVKRQFTISCKEIIENEFGKRLDATEMASLREWIAVEERRDHGGLGRAFLQNPGPSLEVRRIQHYVIRRGAKYSRSLH